MSSTPRRAPEPPPKGFARRVWRFVRHDVGRKLLALLLAVLVWLKLSMMVSDDLEGHPDLDVIAVGSRREATQAMQTVPAVYVVVPRDVIVRDDLSRIKVTVSGRGLIEHVKDLKLSAIVEIDNDILGTEDEVEWSALLQDRTLFESKGAEPELSDFMVEPELLRLNLARRAEAEMLISHENVTVTGTPREGYEYDREAIVVHPNRVVITGPRSAIDGLAGDPSSLRLSPIDVTSAVFEVTQQVGIDVEKVDRSVALRTAGGVVEVTVPIRPKDMMKELLGVPVVYVNEDALAGRGRRVASRTETLDVQVWGPRSFLSGMTSEDLMKRIRLEYDLMNARVDRAANERVSVYRQNLLDEATVRITNRDGRPLMIEYVLEESVGAGASAAAGGESP